MFSGFWMAISPFIDAKTKAKVRFVSRSQKLYVKCCWWLHLCYSSTSMRAFFHGARPAALMTFDLKQYFCQAITVVSLPGSIILVEISLVAYTPLTYRLLTFHSFCMVPVMLAVWRLPVRPCSTFTLMLPACAGLGLGLCAIAQCCWAPPEALRRYHCLCTILMVLSITMTHHVCLRLAACG